MRSENFMCDGPGCTHVKRECNHWFLIDFYDHGETLFTVFRWRDSETSILKHACGEACLLKIISEHIKNATAEK